jgi:hypothetical protein
MGKPIREDFMKQKKLRLAVAAAILAFTVTDLPALAAAHEKSEPQSLEGRIVAIGIPGVSAISVPGGRSDPRQCPFDAKISLTCISIRFLELALVTHRWDAKMQWRKIPLARGSIPF